MLLPRCEAVFSAGSKRRYRKSEKSRREVFEMFMFTFFFAVLDEAGLTGCDLDSSRVWVSDP